MGIETQTLKEKDDLIPSKEVNKPLFKEETVYNRSLRIEKTFKGTVDDALVEAHNLMTNARKDGLDISSVSVGQSWFTDAPGEFCITIDAESTAKVNG